MSRLVGVFRWGFMPLGLFALIAVGVHAAADVMDDRILLGVEWLDTWLDALLAQSEHTAAWVNRIDSPERTLLARGVALAWELSVDVFIALPALGYDEHSENERAFAFTKETWRSVLGRVNRQPTPMRVLRPLLTLVFVVGGAFAVSRLIESTLFAGLVGDVAPASVAAPLARILAGLGMAVVLASHGWRAVLRSLQHADVACQTARRPWTAGLWGTALAIPLAVALCLNAEALLSLVR